MHKKLPIVFVISLKPRAMLYQQYDELSLLIEAGIDTALVDYIEKMADKLESMAHDVRNSAEFFD